MIKPTSLPLQFYGIPDSPSRRKKPAESVESHPLQTGICFAGLSYSISFAPLSEMERETMARKKLARVSTPTIDIPNAPLTASTLVQAKAEPMTETPRPPVIPAAAHPTPADHMPVLATASSSHDLEHPAA